MYLQHQRPNSTRLEKLENIITVISSWQEETLKCTNPMLANIDFMLAQH